MALFGTVATVRTQAPRSPAFETAWAYVAELLRAGSPFHARLSAMAAGESKKHELANGVLAIEQAYTTKARSDGFFESHRKYIDIQLIVAGEEVLEVVDVSRAKVKEAYDAERDLIVYHDTTAASALRLPAGHAAIFFPEDVHMPCMQVEGRSSAVWKSVLKIPVG